jgi:hypothetical protein
MTARPFTALGSLGRFFLRQSGGSVAPMLALALVPIVGAVGAAIDFSRASDVRTKLQASIDAAVLAGAHDGTANWTQAALNVFNSQVPANATVAAPSFTLGDDKIYYGQVNGAISTNFVGLLGFSTLNISVGSKATQGDVPDDSCLLTLDHGQPLSHVSMTFNGNPNVNLNGCGLRSNTSLKCNGHSGGSSASIGAGSSIGCDNPQSNANPLPDPFATVAVNITRLCGGLATGATWVPGSPPAGLRTVSMTGYTEYHVCGDLTLSGNGYLTGSAPSADSVIVIENGGLIVANNAAITALRTAIVLTGNNAYASAISFPNGNGKSATLTISPPTNASNPWQGFSLYQDPALTNGVDNTWGPGANFFADGIVYLPNSNVVIHGNAASSNQHCTKVVANSFTSNGSVNLNFAQSQQSCTDLGVRKWSDVKVHLVQ